MFEQTRYCLCNIYKQFRTKLIHLAVAMRLYTLKHDFCKTMWNILLFPVATIWFANIIFALEVIQRMQGTIKSDFALKTLMDNSNQNVICSPVAVFLPLSKLMLAAKRETLGELEAALGYGPENVREIVPKYIKLLKEVKGVVLTLLSNVYVSSKYTLSETYQAEAADIFGSHVYNLDFQSGATTSNFINNWIKIKTDGKINEIVTPNEIEDSSLLIISAVTFTGVWKTRFKKMLVNSKFYTPTGFIKVPMLEQELNLPYKRSLNLNAQLVSIPFKGDQADFVLILPNEAEDLQNLFKTAAKNRNLLEDEIKSMKSKGVRIFLPEVTIRSRLDITPTLKKLNINNLFTGAGLSEMVQNKVLTLDKAIQSTIVEITEFGTSAFSATMMNNMPAGGYELTMLVDKPFIFIIRVKEEHLLVGLYTGVTETESTSRYMHRIKNYRTFLYQTTEEYDL